MRPRSARLLVVDGEEQVRKLLGTILARAGYEVRSARTAEEALALWGAETRFDGIVSETLLAGMDGHELAQRCAVYWPGSRVIFVCASGTNCGRCPQVPHCIFIEKPFNPRDVLRAIAELLQGHPPHED